MLAALLAWWAGSPPDVLSGWYMDIFDLPYLVNRIRRLLGESAVLELSPFGIVQERSIKTRWGTDQTYDVYGVTVLDGLHLFKKFGVTRFGQQESYKLDHVANTILRVGKIDYGEYGSLHRLLRENPQLYGEYNVRDVGILFDIEKTTGLLSIALELTYRAKCQHSEALGTVGIWEAICYNYLLADGVIVPPRGMGEGAKYRIAGGYVKDPRVGRHRWVTGFDFASLYPNLMVTFNISPETVARETIDVPDIDAQLKTLLEHDSETGPWHGDPHHSVTARGNKFRNDVDGFVPRIIREYFAGRKEIKAELSEVNQRIEDVKREIESHKESLG